MNRRSFFKGLAATAAGLLIPVDVAAEPERKVWALDSTMMGPDPTKLYTQGVPDWIRMMGPHDVPFPHFIIDPGTYDQEIIFYDDHGRLRRNYGVDAGWLPTPEHVIEILGLAVPESVS